MKKINNNNKMENNMSKKIYITTVAFDDYDVPDLILGIYEDKQRAIDRSVSTKDHEDYLYGQVMEFEVGVDFDDVKVNMACGDNQIYYWEK